MCVCVSLDDLANALPLAAATTDPFVRTAYAHRSGLALKHRQIWDGAVASDDTADGGWCAQQ